MFKILFIAVLAAAVVADDDAPAKASDVLEECSYWVYSEHCSWKHFKKQDSEYALAQMTHYRPMHGKMDKPDECEDENNWNLRCPMDPYSFKMTCPDPDDDNDFTRCCKQSCKMCGEESFLTLKKEVEHEEQEDTCKEFSQYYPYHCTELVKEAIPQDGYLVIYVPGGAGTNVNAYCTSGNPVNSDDPHMCVTFKMRQRGDTKVTAQSLTKFDICMDESSTGEFSKMVTCENGGANHLMNYDDADDKCFNVWREFRYQLEDDIIPSAECSYHRRFIIKFEYGVDYMDVDELKIVSGDCTEADGSRLHHGEHVLVDMS